MPNGRAPFVVGFARCNEPAAILSETLEAIAASSRRPSRIRIIDNGDDPLSIRTIDAAFMRLEASLNIRIEIYRSDKNRGCAASWNLLHEFGDDAGERQVILNADCAVAPDTFEDMLSVPAPTAVLAYGFGCFLIDEEIRQTVGPFDAEFYPAYFEDADYRRRMALAGIVPNEWPIVEVDRPAPGRSRASTGITHGSHDPDGYQGWRGNKLGWFWERYEANRRRYLAKWGGEPGHETFAEPFDGKILIP